MIHLEAPRIALILFMALLGGLLSEQWLLSILLSLAGYIGWTLYKLQQLYHWMEKGAKPGRTPDSDGAWERINYQVQRQQKKSKERKQRMSTLLKRFQRIIKGLPYATVVLNGNSEIDWANQRSAQLLGIEMGRDRGQRIDNLVRIPKLHKALEKGKDREIEIDAPGGQQSKLALQLITIHSDLKLLIARDISERVHLNEMRKNFISNASHELRTPLTVISGYLEMLRGSDELPDALRRAVESSDEQSSRMRNIIEDLLTLSRLENSELSEKESQPLNLAKIISRICENQIVLTQQREQIHIRVDSTLQLMGAETEIVSLCTNLIHNALHYNPDGTTIEVEWSLEPSGGGCLVVRDQGEGIAEKHLAHLTERFYRVDQSRSRAEGGTGLGLAIVQHIVQRHGGVLEIESEVGMGSTFSVRFQKEHLLKSSSFLA